MADVALVKAIGTGSFGVVWRGTWSGSDVVVKRLPTAHMGDEVTDAIAMMQRLRHPNLVSLMGIQETNSEINFVMEFMSGGTLHTLLQDRSCEITWATRKKMALDAAKGMSFLHNYKPAIVHRNLKSANLLIDEAGRVKVDDYGLGTAITADMRKGMLGWMAPEVIVATENFGLASDVYSFAIVLWEIAYRQIPFQNMTDFDIMVGVVRGVRPTIDPAVEIPAGWFELMQRCWAQNPSDRPTFAQLTQELAEMDLNTLAKPEW